MNSWTRFYLRRRTRTLKELLIFRWMRLLFWQLMYLKQRGSKISVFSFLRTSSFISFRWLFVFMLHIRWSKGRWPFAPCNYVTFLLEYSLSLYHSYKMLGSFWNILIALLTSVILSCFCRLNVVLTLHRWWFEIFLSLNPTIHVAFKCLPFLLRFWLGIIW